MQAETLGRIRRAARHCRSLEQEFGENPPPKLATVVKLHRCLIYRLATEGKAEPERVRLANLLTRTALAYAIGWKKVELRERELKLAEAKYKFNAGKACVRKWAELKEVAGRDISPEEKARAIRWILFPKERRE